MFDRGSAEVTHIALLFCNQSRSLHAHNSLWTFHISLYKATDVVGMPDVLCGSALLGVKIRGTPV